jgi:hypothetical protein
MNFQQFAREPKSKTSSHIAMAIASMMRFNWNGVDRDKLIKHLKTSPHNFSRDTKELRDLGFFKIIKGEISVNPRLVWSGSERVRQYRIKCWDAGVKDLDDENLLKDEHWLSVSESLIKEKY